MAWQPAPGQPAKRMRTDSPVEPRTASSAALPPHWAAMFGCVGAAAAAQQPSPGSDPADARSPKSGTDSMTGSYALPDAAGGTAPGGDGGVSELASLRAQAGAAIARCEELQRTVDGQRARLLHAQQLLEGAAALIDRKDEAICELLSAIRNLRAVLRQHTARLAEAHAAAGSMPAASGQPSVPPSASFMSRSMPEGLHAGSLESCLTASALQMSQGGGPSAMGASARSAWTASGMASGMSGASAGRSGAHAGTAAAAFAAGQSEAALDIDALLRQHALHDRQRQQAAAMGSFVQQLSHSQGSHGARVPTPPHMPAPQRGSGSFAAAAAAAAAQQQQLHAAAAAGDEYDLEGLLREHAACGTALNPHGLLRAAPLPGGGAAHTPNSGM